VGFARTAIRLRRAGDRRAEPPVPIGRWLRTRSTHRGREDVAHDAAHDLAERGRRYIGECVAGEQQAADDGTERARHLTIVAITGLAVGWRPDASILSVLAGFGVALLFSYALSWACACLGLVSPGPESAQGVGLLALFPLAFVSNSMVPTQRMPWILRVIADWNPVSAVTAACRNLFGNPNPSSTIHAWPMQHPVLAALAWSLLIIAVFAPLASYLFRRRTTE
jgi:hypothetical protein